MLDITSWLKKTYVRLVRTVILLIESNASVTNELKSCGSYTFTGYLTTGWSSLRCDPCESSLPS